MDKQAALLMQRAKCVPSKNILVSETLTGLPQRDKTQKQGLWICIDVIPLSPIRCVVSGIFFFK